MIIRTLLLLVIAAATASALSEENVNQTLDAAPGGKIIVDVDFGTIDVSAGADDKVVVEAHRKIDSNNEAQEKEYLAAAPVIVSKGGKYGDDPRAPLAKGSQHELVRALQHGRALHRAGAAEFQLRAADGRRIDHRFRADRHDERGHERRQIEIHASAWSDRRDDQRREHRAQRLRRRGQGRYERRPD